MHKSIAYPLLAAALGAAAAALRLWQRAAGYDAAGLPIPLAAPSVVLGVFLAACGALFALLARGTPRALADQGAALPRGRGPSWALTGAGALLLAGAGVNLLWTAGQFRSAAHVLYATPEEQSAAMSALWLSCALPLLLAALAVPAAAALMVRAARAADPARERPGVFVPLMPCAFCWVWLIEAYRQHTSNPVVWDYVLLLLAVVALLLSGYDRAGFAFGAGRPRRAVFFSLAALTLAPAALPDCGGLFNALALAALGAQAWTELSALLSAPAGEDPQTPETTQRQEDAPHEPK